MATKYLIFEKMARVDEPGDEGLPQFELVATQEAHSREAAVQLAVEQGVLTAEENLAMTLFVVPASRWVEVELEQEVKRQTHVRVTSPRTRRRKSEQQPELVEFEVEESGALVE